MDRLRDAESRIVDLENALIASEARADSAAEDRDKSERAQEKLLDDLIALKESYKELQKTNSEELKALQERYITALATSSEKTNRAKEAMAERDKLRKGMIEIVAEAVERAKEKIESEKKKLADELEKDKIKYAKEKVELQNRHEDEIKKLDESTQKYRKKWIEADKKVWGLQSSLSEAVTDLGKAKRELDRIKRERNFFERMATENASAKSSDANRLNLAPPCSQTPGNSKPNTSKVDGAATIWIPPPSFVYPQISPPPGVDPFALLKCCEGAKGKVPGPIAAQFERLRVAYEKCNKRRLTDQTLRLFDTVDVKVCDLCNVQVHPVGGFIDHICGKKHTKKLNGVACADAFDFWWSAVETATFDEPQSPTAKIPQTKSELKEWKRESEKTKEMMEKYKNECRTLQESLEEVTYRLEAMEEEKEELKTEAANERERFARLVNEMEEMKRFWEDLGGAVVRKKPKTEIKEEPVDDIFGNDYLL